MTLRAEIWVLQELDQANAYNTCHSVSESLSNVPHERFLLLQKLNQANAYNTCHSVSESLSNVPHESPFTLPSLAHTNTFWVLLLQELNDANTFNICDESSSGILRDEEASQGFVEASQGFASTDPRIRPTFATLPGIEKCAKLLNFAVEAVQRLHIHFGIDGDLDTGQELLREWEGHSCELFELREDDVGDEHYSDYMARLDYLWARPMRRHLMLRLIALNVAAEDLSSKSGVVHFRKDKRNQQTGQLEILNTGSDELTTGSFSPLERAIDEYIYVGGYDVGGGDGLPEDYKIMGSNKHLEKLAEARCTRDSQPQWRIHGLCLLRKMVGDDLADKLDVLLPVRRVLPSLLAQLDALEPDVEDGSSDDEGIGDGSSYSSDVGDAQDDDDRNDDE